MARMKYGRTAKEFCKENGWGPGTTLHCSDFADDEGFDVVITSYGSRDAFWGHRPGSDFDHWWSMNYRNWELPKSDGGILTVQTGAGSQDSASSFKAGDRVRVTDDYADGAHVRAGDTGVLMGLRKLPVDGWDVRMDESRTSAETTWISEKYLEAIPNFDDEPLEPGLKYETKHDVPEFGRCVLVCELFEGVVRDIRGSFFRISGDAWVAYFDAANPLITWKYVTPAKKAGDVVKVIDPTSGYDLGRLLWEGEQWVRLVPLLNTEQRKRADAEHAAGRYTSLIDGSR